jgi:hypothetical protein
MRPSLRQGKRYNHGVDASECATECNKHGITKLPVERFPVAKQCRVSGGEWGGVVFVGVGDVRGIRGTDKRPLTSFYLSVFENVVREMMGSVTEVSAALIPLMKFHASTYLGLWHRLLPLESPHHLNDHTAE